MEVPRCGFHAGWSAGAGRAGVRMRLAAGCTQEVVIEWSPAADRERPTGGTTKPRDGEPVRSGPVAAAKQESTCHAAHPNHGCGREESRAATQPVTPVGRCRVACRLRGIGDHCRARPQDAAEHAPRRCRRSAPPTEETADSASAGRRCDWRAPRGRVGSGAGGDRPLGRVDLRGDPGGARDLHRSAVGQPGQRHRLVRPRAGRIRSALGFKDLFTPDDPKLQVLVNYGIAALFWLIVSAILAEIIRRVGGVRV